MKQVLWRVPLSVTLQNGMPRRFCGPYDALDFLEHEWPCHGKVRDHRGDELVVIDQRLGASSRKRHNKEGRQAEVIGHVQSPVPIHPTHRRQQMIPIGATIVSAM